MAQEEAIKLFESEAPQTEGSELSKNMGQLKMQATGARVGNDRYFRQTPIRFHGDECGTDRGIKERVVRN